MESNAIRVSQKREILVYSIFSLVAIWSIPELVHEVRGGLDPSWKVALFMAKQYDFINGEDIVFTYGPLGYLLFPLYVSHDLWLQSFFYRLLIHSAFFLILALFVRKTENYLINSVILGISAIGSVSLIYRVENYYLSVFSVLMLIWLCIQYDKHKIFFAFPSVISAILLFMKFDAAIASLSMLLISSLYLVYKKKYKEPMVLLSSYLGFVLLLAVMLYGSFARFFSYLYNTLEISVGYTTAMSIDGPLWETAAGAVSWVALIVFMSFAMYKKNLNVKFLFICIGLLFILFKIGFVRHDGHVLAFFSGWSVVLFLYFAVINTKSNGKILRSTVLAAGFSLLVVGIMWTGGTKSAINLYSMHVLENLGRALELSLNPYLGKEIKAHEIADLQPIYPLSGETLAKLNQRTVDVIPWDTALIYAYNLKWNPRPVFQSYLSYTPYLDQLNALHFKGQNAPEYVLFSWKSIDNRYPPVDEPSTIRTLLCSYNFDGTDGQFIILKKDEDSCGNQIPLGVREIKFGQSVDIPDSDRGYVFATIYVKENWLGRLASIFYKAPLLFIELEQESGISVGKYRFIASNAKNGVLFSQFTPAGLFTPVSGGHFESFTISTDSKYSTYLEAFYSEKIEVEFYEVPINLNP